MGLFKRGKGKGKAVSAEVVISDTSPQVTLSPTKTPEDELVEPFVSAYASFLQRPWTLTLEFSHSSSKAFPQVLKLAKRMEGFTETQDDEGQPLYRVSFKPLEIANFEQLYKKVKTWKGILTYVNDKMVSQSDVSKWLICYRDKIACLSSQPLFCWGASTFTSNIFGCHRTKIRDSGWNWNQCWYSIGELDNEGAFHIDKKRIVALMIDNLQPYYICPALNPVHLMFGLKVIPDIINPHKDKLWEYITLSDGKPIGVQPIRRGELMQNTPQFDDLMALLAHGLQMGTIEIF
jgi:hypothetical protein